MEPRQICVEQLEERTLLSATATLSSGSLFIQGDAGLNNLVLTETAGSSTFQVTNNGDNLGTFVVTGSISINMGGDADSVVVDMTGSATSQVPGPLYITTGGGSDGVILDGGAVNGNLVVNTGDGNDEVTVYGTYLNGLLNSVDGGLGLDGLRIIESSEVAGTLAITSVDDIGLNVDLSSGTFHNITINNSGEAQDNLFILGGNATVSGFVSYIGGTLADDIILDADTAGATTINAGQGDNSLRVSVLAGTILHGLTYIGGSGGDNVGLSEFSQTTVLGNVNLNMGGGVNSYTLADAFSVSGNMTITAGTGTDLIGAFNGDIGGHLFVNVGDGDSSIELLPTSLISGTFYWTSGDGEDDVTLAGTISGTVANLKLGSGADTLSVEGTAVIANYLIVDFGLGADTLLGAVLAPKFILINLP